MCLVRSRPAWEEDVTFAPRPSGRRHSHSRRHVSETITTRRRDPPPVTIIEVPPPPPRVSTPIIRPITPPPPPPPAPLPQPTRVEFISVEEDPSHVSVSVSEPRRHRRKKSSSERGSREEVYIERERERIRAPQPPPPREEFETYRYVNGPDRIVTEEVPRERIGYGDQGSPRGSSQRIIHERERVVERDGDGRRRDYYRR